MSARYRVQNNPNFAGLLSKEDIYLLVERGSLARGDICVDTRSGNAHKVGELIGGMPPPRAGNPAARIHRSPYMEIRADSPSRLDVEEQEPDDVVEDGDGEEDFDVTGSGERIQYHAHPSWWAYAKSLFLFVLLGIASGLGFQFGPIYAVVGLGFALITLACIAAVRFSCDYYITDERVELVWGLVGRSSKEVRICDIRAIDVHESGLTGLLGIGTLDFSSAGNAGVEVQFKNIQGAHRVKELVRELQKAGSTE